ncbi:hypothetical protein LGI35_43015 [Streptomyces longhuiensis]|nr:hypothetical protein LGI35_43015 [Streptomyces longhuiensis]
MVTTRAPVPPTALTPKPHVKARELPPPAASAVIVAVVFAGRVKLSGTPLKENVCVRLTARGAFAAGAAPAVAAAIGTSASPDNAMHRTIGVPESHHRLPLPTTARRASCRAVTGNCCACLLLTDVSDSVSRVRV